MSDPVFAAMAGYTPERAEGYAAGYAAGVKDEREKLCVWMKSDGSASGAYWADRIRARFDAHAALSPPDGGSEVNS